MSTSFSTWSWLFLINVPLAAAALVMRARVLPRVAEGRAKRATIHTGPRIVPKSLSSGERRVLAAFLAGRLPAGRLEAELARARSAEAGSLEPRAVSPAQAPAA
jgi:hypothetical protein